MAIVAVTNAELNNVWYLAALRVQTAFNVEALAVVPNVAAVHVLTPTVINGGEQSALRVLRKAFSTNLVASGRPALTKAQVSLTNLGWKYILKDLVTKTNVSLAVVPVVP